jgi:hypothetical protein
MCALSSLPQVDAAAADRERRSAEHWQADCEQKRAHEEAVGRLEKQITALLGDHERVLGALRAEQSTQLRCGSGEDETRVDYSRTILGPFKYTARY